ncbi:MAG: hypothetical protein E2P01_05525 [Acidobacteria bacterium]|nr:MAG: hypothetical protein E2P01_05525 [Acidobacteriota bacterium]
MSRFAILFVALSLFLAAPSPSISAEDAPELEGRLLEFFSHLEEWSPGAFGTALDPSALAAVAERLQSLPAEERQALAEALRELPAWQTAPEALFASVPDELGSRITASREEIEAGQRLRDDLRQLLDLARLTGSNDASLATWRTALDAASTQDLIGLRQHLSRETPAMFERVGALRDAAPPSVLAGSLALARHGALTDADRSALELYRDAVRQLDALGGPDRVSLAGRIDAMTPEQLFALRETLTPSRVDRAIRDAQLSGQPIAPELADELGQFRIDLDAVLTAGAGGRRDPSDFRFTLDQLDAGQLRLLRDRIEQIPAWRETLPIVVRAAAAVPETIDVAELETFRDGLIADLAAQPDTEALVAAIREGSPRELAIRREAAALTPRTGSLSSATVQLAISVAQPIPRPPVDPVPVPRNHVDLDCSIGLGSISLPLGIGTVSLGSINLNFICNPIESVIHELAVFIDGIFDTLKNALTSFFNLLLDASGLPRTPEELIAFFNLAGDFWNNLPEVPQIPCPAEGTTIPFFGEVGEGETAAKYSRYLWVFEKLLGLIPDTEVSLAVKIPAQILYAGVEYVGVCLDAAAAAVDERETAAYRVAVATNFDEVDAGQVALSQQSSIETQSILTAIDRLDAFGLRLAVEENLLSTGNDRIALFQMPAVFGGVLEIVREIVADTITMVEMTGDNVSKALADLDRGDNAYNSTDYKRAYFWYRAAYQAATQAK